MQSEEVAAVHFPEDAVELGRLIVQETQRCHCGANTQKKHTPRYIMKSSPSMCSAEQTHHTWKSRGKGSHLHGTRVHLLHIIVLACERKSRRSCSRCPAAIIPSASEHRKSRRRLTVGRIHNGTLIIARFPYETDAQTVRRY